MDHMFLSTHLCQSQAEAARIALHLVSQSAYFAMEPLPDDQWEIQFKANEGHEERIKELNAARQVSEPLREGDCKNFDTLLGAAAHNAVALISAVRKSDHAQVALVCAVNHDGDLFEPVPLAVMVEDNPYELFYGPAEKPSAIEESRDEEATDE